MKAASEKVLSRGLLSVSADGLQQGRPLAVRSELLPGSALFPPALLHLKEVPKRLFALGSLETLSCPAIAIVGARKATSYGLECAQRFGKMAARLGITVVSGGAIGCDMAAHRGALDGFGTTVVVLGSGADVAYPLRARSLFMEVLEAGGTLISEAPWGSAPLSWHFSKRNRIIAALAQATLIVEAGLLSGTFQTADHTLALGNEVLVVPGPIFSKESKGSNRLLAQGAIPVVDEESFEDALVQIFGIGLQGQGQGQGQGVQAQGTQVSAPFGGGLQREDASVTQENRCQANSQGTLSPEEIKKRVLAEKILMDLQASPMTVDALVQAHKQSVVEIVRVLSTLEVAGKVERQRDGRYLCSYPKR